MAEVQIHFTSVTLSQYMFETDLSQGVIHFKILHTSLHTVQVVCGVLNKYLFTSESVFLLSSL